MPLPEGWEKVEEVSIAPFERRDGAWVSENHLGWSAFPTEMCWLDGHFETAESAMLALNDLYPLGGDHGKG